MSDKASRDQRRKTFPSIEIPDAEAIVDGKTSEKPFKASSVAGKVAGFESTKTSDNHRSGGPSAKMLKQVASKLWF